MKYKFYFKENKLDKQGKEILNRLYEICNKYGYKIYSFGNIILIDDKNEIIVTTFKNMIYDLIKYHNFCPENCIFIPNNPSKNNSQIPERLIFHCIRNQYKIEFYYYYESYGKSGILIKLNGKSPKLIFRLLISLGIKFIPMIEDKYRKLCEYEKCLSEYHYRNFFSL